MTQDSTRLVVAAQAGDHAARRLLAAEAAQLARPWARRLVDDRSAVEDVVQVPEPVSPRRRSRVARVPEPRPMNVVELPEPRWKACTGLTQGRQ